MVVLAQAERPLRPGEGFKWVLRTALLSMVQAKHGDVYSLWPNSEVEPKRKYESFSYAIA